MPVFSRRQSGQPAGRWAASARIRCAALPLVLPLLAMISASSDQTCLARDYYVRATGRDSHDGRTPQTAWATISRALQENLGSGDRVIVGGGTYDVERLPQTSEPEHTRGRSRRSRGTLQDRLRNFFQTVRDNSFGRRSERDRAVRQLIARFLNSAAGRHAGVGHRNRGTQNRPADTVPDNSDPDNVLSARGPVTFISDTTGRFTGDRGPVVLQAGAGEWCVTLNRSGRVSFDGFSFSSHADASGAGNGILATGTGTRISLSNCTFENLDTAVFVREGDISIVDSTLRAVTTGVLTERAARCDCRQSTFTATRGWGLNLDAESSVIEDCSLSGAQGIRIAAPPSTLTVPLPSTLPVFGSLPEIATRQAVISRVSVSGTGYGLLSQNLDSLTVTNLETTGCTEWGVMAAGSQLSITDSLIQNGTNGVSLTGTGDSQRVTVARSTVDGNSSHGLLLNAASLDEDTCSEVTIRNNGTIGLGVVNADLQLNADAGFVLTGNGYGIYSAQGDLTIDGLELHDNTVAVSQTDGRLICRDTTVHNSGTGLQHVRGTDCLIERAVISGARDWAVHLSHDRPAAPVTALLREVQARGGGNGIHASLPAGSTFTLADSEVSGTSGYGILTQNSTALIQNVSVTGNHTGIQHTDGPLSITDCTVSGHSATGIAAAGVQQTALVSVTARRNRVTRNQYGIAAWNVHDASIINNVVSVNTHGLMVQTVTGTANVWNNTLVDNRLGIFLGAGRAVVRNNVVVCGDGTGIHADTIGIHGQQNGTLTHSNNLVFGQATLYSGVRAGARDIQRPPRFADYHQGDFRLAKGSPAINAGIAADALVTRDLTGVPRPMFDAFEIGAFEYDRKDGSVRIVEWAEQASPTETVLKSVSSLLP